MTFYKTPTKGPSNVVYRHINRKFGEVCPSDRQTDRQTDHNAVPGDRVIITSLDLESSAPRYDDIRAINKQGIRFHTACRNVRVTDLNKYTVKNSVFQHLTEPVPYTFVCVNRRNNDVT